MKTTHTQFCDGEGVGISGAHLNTSRALSPGYPALPTPQERLKKTQQILCHHVAKLELLHTHPAMRACPQRILYLQHSHEMRGCENGTTTTKSEAALRDQKNFHQYTRDFRW